MTIAPAEISISFQLHVYIYIYCPKAQSALPASSVLHHFRLILFWDAVANVANRDDGSQHTKFHSPLPTLTVPMYAICVKEGHMVKETKMRSIASFAIVLDGRARGRARTARWWITNDCRIVSALQETGHFGRKAHRLDTLGGPWNMFL